MRLEISGRAMRLVPNGPDERSALVRDFGMTKNGDALCLIRNDQGVGDDGEEYFILESGECAPPPKPRKKRAAKKVED